MRYPMKNLRTTDDISFNHLQLDHKSIPLFPVLCVQLQAKGKIQTEMQKILWRLDLWLKDIMEK